MRKLPKKERKKYNKLKQQLAQERKKQNQKKSNKESNIVYNYDKCDFPIAYSEKRLVEGWYDFNDSTVKPIMPGTLQK